MQTTNRDTLPGRKEVAEYLGLTVQALAHLHFRGDGPPSMRVGRSIRYRWEDVDAWLDARKIHGSNDRQAAQK